MILTKINGRYFLEVSEEQVARAQALAAAYLRYLDNQCQREGRALESNPPGPADILQGILAPGLIQQETKWLQQLRELEAGRTFKAAAALLAYCDELDPPGKGAPRV